MESLRAGDLRESLLPLSRDLDLLEDLLACLSRLSGLLDRLKRFESLPLSRLLLLLLLKNKKNIKNN